MILNALLIPLAGLNIPFVNFLFVIVIGMLCFLKKEMEDEVVNSRLYIYS
jgi:hypothetical protein